MNDAAWFFQTHGSAIMLGRVLTTLLIIFVLYQSNYLVLFLKLIARHGRPPPPPLAPEDCPDAMLVLPTLLVKPAELDGLQRAITSVLDNGYPGRMLICPAIDHASAAPTLVARLRAWVRELELRDGAEIVIATSPVRVGKAMAIEQAIRAVRAQIERGERQGWPTVFFSMDADSEVTPGSLERATATMLRRGRWSGDRPLIVPANLGVRTDHYWQGWRHFFTVAGQLSIQVATEFTVCLSLNRHNGFRLMPVVGVSGALYATWTDLYLEAPRYAAFTRSLRKRDWLWWWLGRRPPSYRDFKGTCPEATIGPGDDTWIAWLAISARWSRGPDGERIDLELPPTPWHALYWSIRSYFVRAVVFEPEARVYTSTPTSIRGLYKQRVRWNSARVWLLGRFGTSLLYKWQLGLFVVLEVGLTLLFAAVLFAVLLLWPLSRAQPHWLPILLLATLASFLIRAGATVLGMLQEGDFPRRWHKLLALPLSGLYRLVFNTSTAIVGYFKDIFLFGLNTNFAPEETLERTGTGRVALAYRCRRAVLLAVRAVRHGDVPLGRFWLGWHETPWTPNGYRGWTNPARRRPAVHGPGDGHAGRAAGSAPPDPPGSAQPVDHGRNLPRRGAGRRGGEAPGADVVGHGVVERGDAGAAERVHPIDGAVGRDAHPERGRASCPRIRRVWSAIGSTPGRVGSWASAGNGRAAAGRGASSSSTMLLVGCSAGPRVVPVVAQAERNRAAGSAAVSTRSIMGQPPRGSPYFQAPCRPRTGANSARVAASMGSRAAESPARRGRRRRKLRGSWRPRRGRGVSHRECGAAEARLTSAPVAPDSPPPTPNARFASQRNPRHGRTPRRRHLEDPEQLHRAQGGGRQGHRRPGRHARPPADRPARRRARPARGRARPGQDAHAPDALAGARRPLFAASSSRPTCCRPTSIGTLIYDPRDRRFAVKQGPSSPTSCWPTRSTAPRPRSRARCSRRCRSGRSPSATRRSRCPSRSWCWRRRTRSSRRAPTRCPRRSSTASC